MFGKRQLVHQMQLLFLFGLRVDYGKGSNKCPAVSGEGTTIVIVMHHPLTWWMWLWQTCFSCNPGMSFRLSGSGSAPPSLYEYGN